MKNYKEFVDKLIADAGISIAARAALLVAVRERDDQWSEVMREALRVQGRMTGESVRAEMANRP